MVRLVEPKKKPRLRDVILVTTIQRGSTLVATESVFRLPEASGKRIRSHMAPTVDFI